MRCLRLLTFAFVLCGLVGPAAADTIQFVTPVPFGFGTHSVSEAAATGTITLNETGPSDVTITGFSKGVGCNEFTATMNNLPVTFNDQADIHVTYDPVDRGADTCVITILGSFANQQPLTFTLTGTGTAALLAVTSPAPPDPLAFADQPYNTGTGETKAITIKNTGTEPLALANLTVTLGGADAAQFSLGSLTAGDGSFPLSPNETATQLVTFNPSSVGAKSATVTFSASTDLATDPSPVVTLSGKGTQSIDTVPSKLLFAAAAVGAGRNANLVVMNTGDAPLNISSMSIAVGGMLNGTEFAFTDHGCTNQTCNNPGVINAGQMDTFAIRCTPGAPGWRGAIMTIMSDDGTTGSRTVALKCEGNNLDLGSDKVGPPPTAPQNITVANPTGSTLTYTIGTSAAVEFPLTCAGGCATRMVAAGASDTVQVAFDAQAAGARSATLTITASSDADLLNTTLGVTGTGTQPAFSAAPSPLAFNDVPVAQVNGATTTLTITNTGTAPMVITQMSIGGDATNQFSFATATCASGHTCNDMITINPGAPNNTATVTLRCDPTTAGDKTANLSITDDAPGGPHVIPLTCTGTVPDVALSQMMLDFGNQRINTTSAPAKTFTVSNAAAAHTAPLDYSVTLPMGSQFAISCSAPGCSGTLAAGASITVSVTFTPTSTGMKMDNITVSAPDDPDEMTTMVLLTGTGTQPSIAVAPSPLAFGDVPIAQVNGATADLTITNGGGAALNVSAMTITGDAGSNFTFATAACPNGTTCNSGFAVNPGAPNNTATVTVRCDPTTTGDKTAMLNIVSDAPTSPTAVPLTCTGTVPDVAVSQMMLDFGNQRVGVPSAPAKTFTVSNSAAAHTAPLAYTVSEASPDYSIVCSAPGCTGTLAAGAMITVSVTFTPSSAGVKMADITVATPTDPDELSTAVMVTGTGVEPVVVVDAPAAPPLAFGDVDVNATSAAGTITLRNSGTSDLSISGVTIVGADANQFSITAGGTGAQTLSSTGGMNTRTWSVTCHPTTIGAKVATFQVTHDAPTAGSLTTVGLTCTGRAAIFTASVVAPTKLDFGQVQVNTDSMPMTFTFTNTGNKNGRITMLTSTSNVFTPTTMANLMNDIAPNGSITVSVVFHPVTTLVVNEQVCAMNTGLTSPVCIDVTGDGQSIGLDVSPPIDFGSVRFDAAPIDSMPVTITNTGESQLRVDSITSAGAPFTIVAAPVLPITLNLNQTATFKVRLTPTPALGTVTKNITVNGAFTVSGAPANSQITATARITAPQVSMTSDSFDFGMVDVDDPGTPVDHDLTIMNTADAATGSDLHVGVPALTSGAPDFSIVNGAPASVPPGGSTTVKVRFAPTSAGVKTGQIQVTIDAQTGMTYTIALRGTAIDQNVACNPMTIMFPTTVRRQAATPIDATVTNLDFAAGPGTAAMLDYTATITGTDAGDFSLPQPDAAGTIAGNAMKSLPITFTPTVAGAGRTANLVVSWNDAGARSCTVTLTGEGRLRMINVAPATIDFGTIAVGSTLRLSEIASTLQLTSAEPADAPPTTIAKLTTSGAQAMAFTVVDGTTSHALPVGGKVEYDVEFAPTEAGVFQADIDVYFDQDPDAQYTFHVTGRAVALDLHGGGCDAGGGTSGAGLAAGLALLALGLVRRRRARA